MRTWRERIAEAKWTGDFTWGDTGRYLFGQCPARELSRAYGLRGKPAGLLYRYATKHLGPALRRRDFVTCERVLNELEDRALTLKRAQPG